MCNRTYYNKYKFNKRVRNATKSIEKDIETLNAVNVLTTSEIITEDNDSIEPLDLTSFNDNNDNQRDRDKMSTIKKYVTTHFQQSENTIISCVPQMLKNLTEAFPTVHIPLHAKHSIARINCNFFHASDSILIKKSMRKTNKNGSLELTKNTSDLISR